MEQLEVTWPRVVSVWWNFIWRSIAFGVLAGILASVAVTISGAGRADSPAFELVVWLITIPLGIWIMKMLLVKEYYDFRIVLVPVEPKVTGVSTSEADSREA